MSERTRLVLFVGGMLLVFAAVSYVVRSATEFDDTRDHASTRTNPWGTKAWRDVLETWGVATDTWGRPLTHLSSDVPMLVILDPTERIDGDELSALDEWVADGGRLVIAPFNYREGSGSGRLAKAYVQRALNLFGVRAVNGDTAETLARPAEDDPLTADVAEVLVPTEGRLNVLQSITDQGGSKAATVLLRDEKGRPVAVEVAHGHGTALILAEAEILANATLPEADNVVLAANLVFAGGAPETVYFDEYHHGFADTQSVFGGPEVDVTAFRNTALALLAVVLVCAIGHARRFGAPVEEEAVTRRSAADYVRALAQIHGRAGAASTAASMLAAGLRRKAAAAAHVPATTDRVALAGALTSRGLPGDEIGELLVELEQADRSMTDGQLLALAQQAAHYERML